MARLDFPPFDDASTSSSAESSRPPSPAYSIYGTTAPPPRDISFAQQHDAFAPAAGPSRSPPATLRAPSLASHATPTAAAYAAHHAGLAPLSRKSSASTRSKGKDGGGGGKGKSWLAEHWSRGGGGTRSGSVTEDEMSEREYQYSDDVKETPTLFKSKDETTGKSLVNQYLILRELGRGQHGKVRLAQDTLDGSYWAIKIINRKAKKKLSAFSSSNRSQPESAQQQKEDKLRKEIAILKKLRHEHVVRLREVIDAPASKYIFLVFEYMEGGEVKWRTEDERPILTVEQTRRTFRDIVLGLEYLHHQGIIHRDIKPANLLWSADHSVVKITDFGVSHHSEVLQAASASAAATAAGGSAAAGSSRGPGTGTTSSPTMPSTAAVGGDEPSARFPAEDGVLSPASSGAASCAGERYGEKDEEALAKTAGSPAFFAPELCYGGDTTPVATTPLGSPPAGGDDAFERAATGSFFARLSAARPSLSQRSSSMASARPGGSSRPQSSSSSVAPPLLSPSLHQTPSPRTPSKRPPITKAIDVWALGVTLYCLLFARVPFEAHSEFALFGVIPFQDFAVPDVAGSDRMRTGGRAWDGDGVGQEAKELGNLLNRLLEKDPLKRIKLEDVKRHPWVLRGIDNAHDWLTRTDPNNDTFVTVTRDEVATALTLTLSARIRRTASRIKQRLFHSSSSTSVRSGSRERADGAAGGSSVSRRSSGAQSGMLSSKHSFLHQLRNGRHHGGGGGKNGDGSHPPPPLSRKVSLASTATSGFLSRRHSYNPTPAAAPPPPAPALAAADAAAGSSVDASLGPYDGGSWALDARGWRQESLASNGSGSTTRAGTHSSAAAAVPASSPPPHWLPPPPKTTAPSSPADVPQALASPALSISPRDASYLAVHPAPSPSPHASVGPACSSTRSRSPFGGPRPPPPALIPRKTPVDDAYLDADEDLLAADADDDDDDGGLELAFGKHRKRSFLAPPDRGTYRGISPL